MKRHAAAMVIGGVLLCGQALADNKSEAKARYEKGVMHYNLDEFPRALEEFKEAYRLKSDPAFLFNIAQCYRKLRDNREALSYYRKYLRAFPNPPNRPEVERLIADLDATIGRENPPSPPPEASPGPVSAPSAVAAAPQPAAPTAPPAGAAAAGALEARPPEPQAPPLVATASDPAPGPAPSRPLYTRWWFWTAVGVLAAGTAASVVILSSDTASPYKGNVGPGTVILVRE